MYLVATLPPPPPRLPLSLSTFIFDCLLLNSRREAHFTLIAANTSVRILMADSRWPVFSFVYKPPFFVPFANVPQAGLILKLHCPMMNYVFSLIRDLLILFLFCFVFFMKVPFNMGVSVLRSYFIPYPLLLYSVPVKWILICVQNMVQKDNTLDYILCTHLCCVVFLLISVWHRIWHTLNCYFGEIMFFIRTFSIQFEVFFTRPYK